MFQFPTLLLDSSLHLTTPWSNTWED